MSSIAFERPRNVQSFLIKMRNTLRQFGLEYCELTTMIENISVFLRCLTINIDNRYKKGIPIINYVIMLPLIASYLYVYVISMSWFVFIRCPETGDLVSAMVILSLGVCSEVSFIKLAIIALNSDKLRSIVDSFLECDAHVVPGSRYSNNLLKTLKSVKRRVVLYWVTLLANAFFYNSAPVFLSGRHLSEDLLVIYGLEPTQESPNFEIATILATTAVFFVCFTVASTSGLIIILVGYIEANMFSLSEEIKEIWKDSIEDKKKNKEYNHLKNQPIKIVNMCIKKRLVAIIEMHKRNIELLNDVERLFRIPIGAGFLFQTISIIAQLLGGLENTYLQLPFSLIQISVDCYIGQKIMDASLKFEEAVYDCKWEKFDNSNMKLVTMILHNSQKTLKLSAGGMATLSTSCLLTILRFIHTTYMTLRSIVNGR